MADDNLLLWLGMMNWQTLEIRRRALELCESGKSNGNKRNIGGACYHGGGTSDLGTLLRTVPVLY